MPSIDELYIDIRANAVKANDSIDRLSTKIGALSTSLSSLKTGNLTGLANGVQRLSSAMQGMKNVGTADFTRLTKNLNNIGTVDTAGLNRLASATTQISKSFSSLSGASSGIKAIGDLANGIKQLGYASSTKAIANIPQLANALKGMMATLSSAPKVSQNLINMTNALARLSRTGGAAGTAANSLVRSFNAVPSATSRAGKGFTSLASAIGKVYATYWLLFRAFGKISQAMGLASNLTEVENVINHTFGAMRTKLDDFTKDSIEKFGLAELSAKQYAGRFQAMGKAMGISNNAVASSTEFLNEKLGKNAKIYGDLGNSMADMSVNLTKLTSDYASFFDVAQSDVAEDFQSIFTGQTKPLRAYGLDLTQATLKEYALANGLNANINAMSQAEKAMLRYQYVMDNSSHIMGDFARTSDTWHNTITRLKNNFQALGTTVGRIFINLLKPVAVFVNNAVVGLNKVAKAIENALGKLLGWKYEEGSGGMTSDYEEAADYADDMASGTGKAAKAAKELKKQLQGIDELNVLTTNDDNGTGGGSGGSVGTGGAGGTTGTDGSWVKTSGMFDSDVKTWEDLGKKIGGWLKTAMDNIPWTEIYKKAGDFGKNLASFINGLFSKDKDGKTVLDSLGTTIAGGLKSAIIFAFTLGKGIKFKDIGEAIAGFFNSFSEEMNKVDPVTGMTGWQALAETLNTWVDGIKETIVTAIKKIKWKEVIKGAFDFASGLELDTLAVIIGAFVWKYGGKEIVKDSLKSLFSSKIATGIGETSITLGNAIGITIITIAVGFKVGQWLYDNTSFKDLADVVIRWMTKENGTEISVPKVVTVVMGGLAISLGTLATAEWIFAGAKVLTAKAGADAIATAVGGNLSSLMPIAPVAVKLALLIAVAKIGYEAGKKLYEWATGEEAQGGIADLLKDEVSWSEIGQAISDGAVVDITLTPLLRWWSGDKSITTQEVIDAGAQMIDDVVKGIKNLPKKALDIGIDLGAKLTGAKLTDEQKEQVRTAFSKLPSVAVNMIANFIGWQKGESFASNIGNMVAKFGSWLLDTTFGKTVGGMIASFVNWVLDTAFGKTIGGMIASFVNHNEDEKGGFKSTIGNMIASITKADKDKSFDDKNNKLEMNATVKKATKSKNFKGGTLSGLTAKISKFTDAIGKKNKTIEFKAVISSAGIPSSAIAAMKKAGWTIQADGGVYQHGKWKDIPQYAAGGFPSHGSMFIAGEVGAEVVGHINGRTEVLNQSQMASTMYQAVVSANSEQNQLLRQQNQLLADILQKETGINYKDIFKATQQGNREYKAVTGVSAFI